MLPHVEEASLVRTLHESLETATIQKRPQTVFGLDVLGLVNRKDIVLGLTTVAARNICKHETQFSAGMI